VTTTKRYSNSFINDFVPIKGRHDLPPLERLMLRIIVVDSGCWLWLGGKTKTDGYGRLMVDGVKRQAHVFSYETFIRPVPEGLTLDHLCKTPSCVNPSHLVPLDGVTNILIGDGPPAINSRMSTCKFGHAFTTRIVKCHGLRYIQRFCSTCRNNWLTKERFRKCLNRDTQTHL